MSDTSVDEITAFAATSVKACDVEADPKVAMQWQVTEAGDGIDRWRAA